MLFRSGRGDPGAALGDQSSPPGGTTSRTVRRLPFVDASSLGTALAAVPRCATRRRARPCPVRPLPLQPRVLLHTERLERPSLSPNLLPDALSRDTGTRRLAVRTLLPSDRSLGLCQSGDQYHLLPQAALAHNVGHARPGSPGARCPLRSHAPPPSACATAAACGDTPGGVHRRVLDSGLDAFSRYPSRDGFASPAVRPSAETSDAA